MEQFTSTPPSMKSRRQLPAPSNTPAISGPGGGSLAAEGRTWATIWPKVPSSELPVQVAGSRPDETQRRMARSSAFFGGVGRPNPEGPAPCRRWTGVRLGGLRIGLRDGGVVDFLLLLFERLGRGDFLRRGLLAGREELLQRAAGLAGVGHEAVVLGAVGMGDLAGRGVGEIAYVAAFDVHAFAVAYIGHVQLDVLRDGENPARLFGDFWCRGHKRAIRTGRLRSGSAESPNLT